MAKDFMMDVSPESREDDAGGPTQLRDTGRSIRNITLEGKGVAPRMDGMRQSPEIGQSSSSPVRSKSRAPYLLWGVAGVALIVVLGAGALTLLGETTVAVTPRAHTITFDSAIELTAYPETSASSSLVYTMHTETFEEYSVVPAKGVQKVQEKASGAIIVFNEYSETPVKLIKNTRFQSSGGFIFRIPASIEVPGKKGSTPGQLKVTVFADTTGPEYNIQPDKFTVPGLKGTPDMFSGVYARSETAFTGGFAGERAAVDPKTLVATRAELQSKLKQRAVAPEKLDGAFVIPDGTSVVFESPASQPEPGGGVKITERATVSTPVFSAHMFAQSVAKSVTADAENYTIAITPNAEFKLHVDSKNVIAGKPIPFSLSGGAILTWLVDTEKLAQALALRDAGAFQTIVGGFASIDHAEANLAPFWRSQFPEAENITINVEGEEKNL